jgi:hypothetical protein
VSSKSENLQEKIFKGQKENCIFFNTDNYYYSDQCLIKEKNIFKVYANIRDKFSTQLGLISFYLGWSSEGPFSFFSDIIATFGKSINFNATIRYFFF